MEESIQSTAKRLVEREVGNATPPPESPRPFPYWPPESSVEMKKRQEAMIDLDKWSNNDPFMAKRCAESLIFLLADQFDVNLVQLEK